MLINSPEAVELARDLDKESIVDSSVNDRNIELAGLDKLGDLLKVAIR
jgi:hypothetical protein